MSENNLRRQENRQWYPMALLFLFLNTGIILSQGFFIFAVLICPVYLVFMYSHFGWNAALFTGIAGLLPYALLGGTESLVMAVLTFGIMTGGHIVALKFSDTQGKSVAILSIAAILSMVVNTLVMVYLIDKTDMATFFNSMATTGQNMIKSIVEQGRQTLPESQRIQIQETLERITPRFIIDQTPAILIQYGLTAGYLSLRLSKRTLGKLSAKAPYFSEIKVNALILFSTFIMMIAGVYLDGINNRAGSLLYYTGYGVLYFLGAVGAGSLLWWFMTKKLMVKNKLFKLLGVISIALFLGLTPLVIGVIVDSVMDFRNISGKSLYNYIKWKVTSEKEG